jgi:hypothetical protein
METLDPATFDLDAWIDEAKLPEASVTVCGRGDLLSLHAQLVTELTARPGDDDERMSSGKHSLAQRVVELEKTMLDSQRTFTFRAATTAQIDEARKGSESSPHQLSEIMLTAQCVSPNVPVDRWAVIRDKIGPGQFDAFLTACTELNQQRTLTVPFSQAAWSAARTRSD